MNHTPKIRLITAVNQTDDNEGSDDNIGKLVQVTRSDLEGLSGPGQAQCVDVSSAA